MLTSLLPKGDGELPQDSPKKPRKVPLSWCWWKVSSPTIPEPYIVAAAHKLQAATIVGKMNRVFINPDDPVVSVTYICDVSIRNRHIHTLPERLWWMEDVNQDQ